MLALDNGTGLLSGYTAKMDAGNRRFALVVPTFNEAGNIGVVLERAVNALNRQSIPWQLLVVDDESSDGTHRIACEFAKSESRVRVLQRRAQRGLAGAITYGWSQTDAELLGVIDADLQHPPELLPDLLAELSSGFDIAIASRYVRPHSMDAWSPIRRAISRCSILLSTLVQKPVKVLDPMSGFFVLRRDCIAGMTFQQSGFKLLLEILSRGHIRSAVEVPFTFEPRQRGKSKANAITGVQYITLLYRLCLKGGVQK